MWKVMIKIQLSNIEQKDCAGKTTTSKKFESEMGEIPTLQAFYNPKIVFKK